MPEALCARRMNEVTALTADCFGSGPAAARVRIHVDARDGAGMNQVRGWIHRARRGGFLEGPMLQGKASGTLSAKAATYRNRSGE
jgi:hypothetical protein